MKTASLNDLKKELQGLNHKQIMEVCIRLTKYKKENKELLSYLLFEADNEEGYKKLIKENIDEQFSSVQKNNLYLATKIIRKILRSTKKYIKYSGLKQTEVELLIYFCQKLKTSGIKVERNTALNNLFQQQLKKINQTIEKLHEDLQFDYFKEIESLQ